ncbi:MAG: SDR family oxidoreductase [Oscillospiraceae bacterium]|nr:SDR family oxidoreductase [Oscillospiraceae bacterium]MBR3952585.1 SDR family oxidoreductase [Oscillospiraceae bacterium]
MRKTVLITGASSGIGYEFAKIFASNGDNVILVARNEEKLFEIQKKLQEKYRIFAYVYAKDLSKENAAKELFSEVTSDGHMVDYLINNAGFGDNHRYLHTDFETHEKMVKLNVLSLMELCHLFGRVMYNRGEGKILNVASIAAFTAGPYMSVYFASKAFVLSFSEALNEEFKSRNVSVTCLCPGPTYTNFGKTAEYDKSNAFRYLKPANAADVAVTGYKAMMKNKSVALHGAHIKALAFFSRFTPRTINTKTSAFLNKGNVNNAHKL